MTEDFDRTERALREAFSAAADGAPAPAGTYLAVRQQHRRRGLIAGAGAGTVAAVTAVAVGVPVALGPQRTAGPPELGPQVATISQQSGVCPPPGTTPATGPTFPAQHDVRGSLGGDTATVQAVLRTAWTLMAGRVKPATVRVDYVQRVGDRIMAHVLGTNGTGNPAVPETSTYGDQIVVTGPDRDRLSASRYSGWTVLTGGGPTGSAAKGATVPADKGPLIVDNLDVLTPTQPVSAAHDCGRDYVVVLSAPGTSATVQAVTALTAAGQPVRTALTVPMAPDGLGILEMPSPGGTITLVRGGRTMVKNKRVPLRGGYEPLTEAQMDAATRGWDPGSFPADHKRMLVEAAIWQIADATYKLPVSDFRTLWLKDTGDGLAGLFTWTVPGGVRLLAGVKDTGPRGVITGGYGGLLPPGTNLDDVVVAWNSQENMPVPGEVPVVAAPRGVRAEAVLPDGSVKQVPMTRGGAALPLDTTSVRVYDAGGRLLGTRKLGTGLIQPKP